MTKCAPYLQGGHMPGTETTLWGPKKMCSFNCYHNMFVSVMKPNFQIVVY